MLDRNNGNLLTGCKDQDGILPIRRVAWKLQEPLPSTSGSGSNFSTPTQTSNQHGTRGESIPSFLYPDTPGKYATVWKVSSNGTRHLVLSVFLSLSTFWKPIGLLSWEGL